MKSIKRIIYYFVLSLITIGHVLFWIYFYLIEAFIKLLFDSGTFIYFAILFLLIYIIDQSIKGEKKELKYRLIAFSLLVLNALVSRFFYHSENMEELELLFITMISLPYMLLSYYLMRKFIKHSENATDEEIERVESGVFLSRIFLVLITITSMAMGYVTHLLI